MHRILLATDVWEQINGITRIYKTVLSSLAVDRVENCHVVVISPSRTDEVIETGVATLVKKRPVFLFKVPGYSEIETGFYSSRSLNAVSAQFGPFDVVHLATQGLVGLSVSRWASRAGITLIGFYHTDWPLYIQMYGRSALRGLAPTGLLGALARRWDREIYGKCRSVIAHEEAAGQLLSARLKTHVDIVSSFVDTSLFRPGHAGKESALNGRPLRLGYVGRLAIEKGLSEVVQFSRKLSGTAEVHIVGGGPLMVQLQRVSSVRLHGAMCGEALVDMYRSFDFVVLPSKTETLGLVLLEAASCGIPFVVKPGTPGARLAVQFGAGVIAEQFDSSLGERLRRIRQGLEYAALQDGCRLLSRTMDVRGGVRQLLDIWGVT